VLSDGEVEVQLETRFPIFGGWKTQFHLGYSVPTENALTRAEDRYHLKVDFFAPFDNVWVEDLELKVRRGAAVLGAHENTVYGGTITVVSVAHILF
jgi:hypothetical protein